MNTHILNAPGELFLGSDSQTALAQGSRHFRSAANAVRFAMEQAAPVSLRGACLKIGEISFGPSQIRALHGQLQREAALVPSRRSRSRRPAFAVAAL